MHCNEAIGIDSSVGKIIFIPKVNEK